jgi:hypothetical protein
MLMLALGLATSACGSSSNAPAPQTDGGGADGDASTVDGPVDAAVDAVDAADDAATTLTAAPVTTIVLPGIPMVAAYNAGTKKAYFACQTQAKASAGVAVVDDTTNAVVATILPASPLTSLAANATTKKIYGVEGDQIDVIDSATDAITAMVETPDQALISGLAVDETHNRIYAVGTLAGATRLYVLDGAMNTITAGTPVLLTPTGAVPVAVDAATQRVFVLGVDSNQSGVIVTLDGTSGSPLDISFATSKVDPAASSIVPMGDGTAASLLVSPGIIDHLDHLAVMLPTTFTPSGVTVASFGAGTRVLVVGFDGSGVSDGYVAELLSGTLSPFSLDLGGGAFANTVAAQLLVGKAIAGGSEAYVDVKPAPVGGPAFAPAATLKVTLTAAP